MNKKNIKLAVIAIALFISAIMSGCKSTCNDINTCTYSAPSNANAVCTAVGGHIDVKGNCQY